MRHRFNEIFSKVYVVNIDSATERMKLLRNELVGIKYERFSAVTPQHGNFPSSKKLYVKKGALACALSHAEIIRTAKRENYKNILIFEDDVVLDRDFINYNLDLVANHLSSKDWALFYLGGLHLKNPTLQGDGIVDIVSTIASYAYAINSKYFDVILREIEKFQCKLPLDIIYAYYIQNRFPCYGTLPRLFLHRSNDYSYVEGMPNQHVDLYRFFKDTVDKEGVHFFTVPLEIEKMPWWQFLPK